MSNTASTVRSFSHLSGSLCLLITGPAPVKKRILKEAPFYDLFKARNFTGGILNFSRNSLLKYVTF